MNTEEVIQALGLSDELAEALVAAGTAILDGAPELAQNAANDLDMYNWYRDDEYYGYPSWMTAIGDNDDAKTPLAIFDIVQYPANHHHLTVQWEKAPASFEAEDPMLSLYMAYCRSLDQIDESLQPIHHVGNGVLMGMLATLSSEYAYEIIVPVPDPDSDAEPSTFRAYFRGGKLEHSYMLVFHPDLYVSRSFGLTGVVRH